VKGTLRTYLLEAKYELLKTWRLPAFAIPTLTFPLFFYVLFGLTFGGRAGGVRMATYLIATYGAFGVMGSALFGFGVGVAVERGQGWMLLKRATAMPPLAYFAAKMITAMLFGALVVTLMAALGVAFGGVSLSAQTWLTLLLILTCGALPFCAFGLLVGYLVGPNAAPAVVNLIYLPSAFLSGMWMPIHMLPPVFQAVAPFLPSYHFAQLALTPIGASLGGSPWRHAAVLVAFTAVCLFLARRAYVRDEGRTFG
jgi:ABC-2 type transport system permease protein